MHNHLLVLPRIVVIFGVKIKIIIKKRSESGQSAPAGWPTPVAATAFDTPVDRPVRSEGGGGRAAQPAAGGIEGLAGKKRARR